MTDRWIGRIEFYATGLPKPQGSKKAIPHATTGRPILIESNPAGHHAWRRTVATVAAFTMRGRPPLEGPLTVQMTFALPRPKSHPKTRPSWPTGRPDLDKLARAVGDSCTGIVWRDDAQVVYLVLRKCWALIDTPHEPGVHVAIATIEPPP